jgi:hypothetical protein
MDTPTRKALELLIEIAEQRRIHEMEDEEVEFAARINEAVTQVRSLLAVMGDAAS